MLYVDTNNEIRYTTNENEVLLFSLLQELKLFKGENPIRANNGIDYIAVFNYQAFLKMEAQTVCNRYLDSFASLEVGDVTQEGEKYLIALNIEFKDGTIANEVIRVSQ